MTNALRLRRWEDFCRRVTFAPDSVYRHGTGGWEYVPIHPFADEDELLRRLGMAAQECSVVDAWWGIADDATLLEVSVSRTANREPGYYARRTDSEFGWVYLLAVLDTWAITRLSFERAISHFVSLGLPSGERFRSISDAGFVRLVDT